MARIVHICPRYRPAHGGVELFFAKLSERAAAEGHDVTVWTTDALTVRSFTQAGGSRLSEGPEYIDHVLVQRFPVRHVPMQRWTRTAAHVLPFGTRWKADTLRWTPFVPTLTRAAGDRRYGSVDLVHGAGLPYSSLLFAAVRLADRSGAKLVMSPFTHVPPPGSSGRAMRRAYLSDLNIKLLGRADRVFVQTKAEQEMLTREGVTAARQAIVGLGVDPASCTGGDRAKTRASWRVDDETAVIGHLANKSRDKGTIDLLRATERLRAARVPFTLVLAGPEMPAFTAEWAKTPERARIVNLPELTDAERRDFFAAIDIFALPSYVESFGISALEAAVNGVPLVAYDHGGPAEIFRDRVNALLVPAGAIDGLTSALRRVTVDAAERQRLGRAAQALASTYGWTQALDVAMEHYRTLLNPIPHA